MNNKILVAVFASILMASCGSSKKSTNDLAINLPIETAINLSAVKNDKAPVTINPGRFTTETVIYRLPKVVQGTYSVSNFGKYIDDFKAFNYQGEEMVATKIDDNSWTIADAKNLDKITYWVNDTYDVESEGGIGKDVPFSPSGTNIEPENYVLNLHGFIGYFDSLKNNQYKLDVTAPANFVRTSALQTVNSTASEDGKITTTSYYATRYFDITDNPMMYGNLDVEEFQVGSIKIVLSVYSPNKIHSAKSLKETIFKMMEAQKAYMGAINTTPRYDIYVYLSEGKEDSPKGFGALEHHTSTVVVMPEDIPADALEESMIDVVSHEFFHIVTPLSVHSEDVHYFDYNNPTFSKHLWMYEGVTEYFATLFQVNQGLVEEAEFYKKIMDKIQGASRMNDAMSFTIMSENVLKVPYKNEYLNVYQKGALIGMCIDILIREESNGNRGILSLMKELSNKYGKNKPFEDDALIDEIVAMTYPSLGEFFNAHVVGDIPIDYNEYFTKVGLEIGEGKVETNFILLNGVPIVSGDGQKGTIFFTDAALQNSFWKEQGVQTNDVIKSIGGTALTLQNANQILQEVFMWKPGEDIEVVLDRDGKEVLIKTITTQPYTIGEMLVEKPNATEAQKTLRKAWLKG
ncbi:M61 family metallopeptidase [Seonamhaeicola aphaedonensis]|uniref:Putative metalloprotease with PDZ domain n=1 Tax=Seonamhaeicola aphaedonensis TaxID=1461338 RepID=A0A3D9H8Q0_9FLAO|nr:peptidase M61 [Seonamhaeicola aphaedonensis]RED45872.1 putative metalloprotease with PDZ domain [Seonamhaeicola aphaedonensis]